MRWEYLLVHLDNQGLALKKQLDEQGREGWELATIVPEERGMMGIFKRSFSGEGNVG